MSSLSVNLALPLICVFFVFILLLFQGAPAVNYPLPSSSEIPDSQQREFRKIVYYVLVNWRNMCRASSDHFVVPKRFRACVVNCDFSRLDQEWAPNFAIVMCHEIINQI